MPVCQKCGEDSEVLRDCDHTDGRGYCTECYTELHYYLTEEG